MILHLRIDDRFDLMDYELSLLQIDTFADPSYPDEGAMIIRAEGSIGTPVQRLVLIDGVVPHARQKTNRLSITADELPESGTVAVKPQMQSIPMNHKFVLVWHSAVPYFTGIQTGGKYRL